MQEIMNLASFLWMKSTPSEEGGSVKATRQTDKFRELWWSCWTNLMDSTSLAELRWLWQQTGLIFWILHCFDPEDLTERFKFHCRMKQLVRKSWKSIQNQSQLRETLISKLWLRFASSSMGQTCETSALRRVCSPFVRTETTVLSKTLWRRVEKSRITKSCNLSWSTRRCDCAHIAR